MPRDRALKASMVHAPMITATKMMPVLLGLRQILRQAIIICIIPPYAARMASTGLIPCTLKAGYRAVTMVIKNTAAGPAKRCNHRQFGPEQAGNAVLPHHAFSFSHGDAGV